MRRPLTTPRWLGRAFHPPIAALLSAALLALAVALVVSACAGTAGDTPTSTPDTPQGRLSAQIQRILQGSRDTSKIAYDPAQRTLVVTVTLATTVPRTYDEVQVAQVRVKSLCFQVQHAAWIVGLPLATAKVAVVGPMFDDYFDRVTGTYGSAVLTYDNAQRFVWETLDPESAWTRYDSTTLSSEFAPFQGWGVTPTAVPGVTATAAPDLTPSATP